MQVMIPTIMDVKLNGFRVMVATACSNWIRCEWVRLWKSITMSSNQVVKVKRETIATCMTCPLCNNLFKQATTISECLHTCKPFRDLSFNPILNFEFFQSFQRFNTTHLLTFHFLLLGFASFTIQPNGYAYFVILMLLVKKILFFALSFINLTRTSMVFAQKHCCSDWSSFFVVCVFLLALVLFH